MTDLMEDESGYPAASILVVDDQPHNLIAMRALLRSLGQRVTTVSSGRDALRAVSTEEFAVILMDVHMPGMDGFETVERLRKEHPMCQAPVLFMSAVYDQPPHVKRAYALGAVDYLPRPVDPDLLRAKVESFVSLYRRGKELRRRAEVIEEQRAAAALSGAASRLKDVYLGVIGHDLRTPLEIVRLVARRLGAGPDPETSRVLAGRLERAVHRAQVIVDNLLDFTRGELGGGITVTRTPADFGEIARSVVQEISLLHPDRIIEVDTPDGVDGEWDVQRVEQALVNAITNAIQHGRGVVSVVVAKDEQAVTVTVHNEGAMSPELLPNLFQPFRRGEGKTEGLGLGLYIFREIVRAHGGTVQVCSTADGGTTFTSSWPRGSSAVLHLPSLDSGRGSASTARQETELHLR